MMCPFNDRSSEREHDAPVNGDIVAVKGDA